MCQEAHLPKANKKRHLVTSTSSHIQQQHTRNRVPRGVFKVVVGKGLGYFIAL